MVDQGNKGEISTARRAIYQPMLLPTITAIGNAWVIIPRRKGLPGKVENPEGSARVRGVTC